MKNMKMTVMTPRWSGSVSGPQTLILAQDQGAEQLTGP